MRVVRSHLLLMIAAGFAVGILLAGSFAADSAYLIMIGSAALAVVASVSLLAVATARLREVVSRESAHGSPQPHRQSGQQEDLAARSDLGIARVAAEKPAWEGSCSSTSDICEALQQIVDQALVVFSARRVEVALVDLSTGLASGEPDLVAHAENRGISASSNAPFACFEQPLLFSGSDLGVVRIWIPNMELSPESEMPDRTKVVTALGFFAREVIMVVMSAWYTMRRREREQEVHAAAGHSLLDYFSEAVSEPIGTVLSGVELLLAGDFGEVDLAQRQSIELLRQNARKLGGVAEEVTLYKEVISGEARPSIASFDAWECTNSVLTSLRPLIEQKAHTLVFAPRGEQPMYAQGDRTHFYRALLALVKNAIVYSPPGGEITVSLSCGPDAGLRVVLQDNGVGIASHEVLHLVQPFRRGTHPYARMQHGIGLGLTLAQELVKLQGGELHLSSTIGEGTHVVVSVPQGTQPLLPFEAQEEEREVAGQGEKILFIQPEESDAVLIVQYLERRGYEVRLALNEKEARRELKRQHIAVVLLSDLFEPQPSSRLAEFVREEQRGRHIPVVLLTRRAFLVEGDWYLREDIDKCFLRPVDLRKLGRACAVLSKGERAPQVAEALV